MTEKDSSDAPVWYSADCAGAWANGYNKAVEDMSKRKPADRDDGLLLAAMLDQVKEKAGVCSLSYEANEWLAEANGPHAFGRSPEEAVGALLQKLT